MYPVGFTFLGLRHNIHESIKMPNCRWRSASYIQACNIRSANTFENYIPTFRGKSVKPWKSLLRPLVWRSFTSLIVLRIINNSLKRIFFFPNPKEGSFAPWMSYIHVCITRTLFPPRPSREEVRSSGTCFHVWLRSPRLIFPFFSLFAGWLVPVSETWRVAP